MLTGREGIGWWKDRDEAIANANRRPIEDAQVSRITELEAERERLREALNELQPELDRLREADES